MVIVPAAVTVITNSIHAIPVMKSPVPADRPNAFSPKPVSVTRRATPNSDIPVLPALTNPVRRSIPVPVPVLVLFLPAPLTETALPTARVNSVSILANQVTPSRGIPVSKTVFRTVVRDIRFIHSRQTEHMKPARSAAAAELINTALPDAAAAIIWTAPAAQNATKSTQPATPVKRW